MEVALAIGDGAVVDWGRLESRSDEAERRVVRHLRLVEQVASLHASLPPVAAFERSLHDSLGDPAAAAGALRVEAPATWGPLAILEPIGSGTYADVYRARDPRLDRPVALKLLRHRQAGDTALESEVIEEARLLARIQHPNVVTVYGAERIDGRVGIWMQLVDGRTLEQELRDRGPFSVDELVAVGTALCRALDAVHEAGLLHRDVKAQNVLRDRDGRVLLTDFGTGREVAQMGTARELAGTPLYLAPEVLDGQPASVASDLYSLGVLLYHLATGSFPVSGRSPGDLHDAHARSAHVPLKQARPNLPEHLVAAIECGLATNAVGRHESARAFDAALERAGRTDQPASGTPSGPLTIPHPRLIVGLVAIITIVATAFAIVVLRRPKTTSATGVGAESALEIRPLTFTGDTSGADISRDGRVVAYLGGDYQSLWVRHVDSQDERQVLPADRPPHLMGLTVTPDGGSVDVVANDFTSSFLELWRVPLQGGSSRRIASDVISAPGWSPDGRRMAFVRETRSDPPHETSGIVIADADGANQRLLAALHAPLRFVGFGLPIGPAASRPAWSPDGRTIATVSETNAPPASARVILIDVTTGVQREAASVAQRSAQLPAIVEVVWVDGTHLLVSRRGDNPEKFQIWRLDVTSGAFTPVTRDLASYQGISITNDRHAVVTPRTETRAAIWVGGASGEGMSIRIPESSAQPEAPSFDDHGDLVYAAETSAATSVWVLRSGTTAPQQVTRGSLPKVTPLGDAVVVLNAGDEPGLFRVDLDGSHLTQLATGPQAMKPALTPDGQTVLFIDVHTIVQSIWSIGLGGGAPRELIRRFAYTPSVSHDGRHLLFGGRDAATNSHPVFIVCDLPACSDARELPIPPNTNRGAFAWTPDGRGIAFAKNESGAPENIWVQPLDGGPIRQLTHFADVHSITDFDWSPDGRQLAVARASTISDVVLLKR
jgi:serine/threonine protein kinase/Tol biopolymer transport system component